MGENMVEINAFANRFGIPADILRAVVMVESGGDPWATRYEPHYRWLWDVRRNKPFRGTEDMFRGPIGVSAPTEMTCQKTSWGLMQVMGAVARERGFDGRFLSELCDVETGMRFGCLHLLGYYRRHGDWEQAVISYNAGSPRRGADGQWVNQVYLNKLREFGARI
jgi:hypothetical protein